MTCSVTRRAFVALCASGLATLGIGGVALAADGSVRGSLSADGSASSDKVRVVTDMKGDKVDVPVDDQTTIVTCNSVATQMVLMLGGEKAAATVGAGFNYDEGGLNRKMYPGLDGVRLFKRDDATVENVAVIDPDLVVIDVPDTIATLRASDIPAVYVSVNSPETIMQAMQIIGGALGDAATKKADDYCAYYQRVLDDTAAASKDAADDAKPRVIYLSSQTGTSGSGSMADSWITTAGCVNVAAEMGLSGARAEANVEAIFAADPEIIVCESQKVCDELLADAAWSEVTAVKNNMVIPAPFGVAVWSMGSADAPLMVQWAAATLNPDTHPDIDVDKVTADFYQTYYGYELTKDDLDDIFHRA